MTHRKLMVASLAPIGLLAGAAAATPAPLAGNPAIDAQQILDRMGALESEVSRLRGVDAELARLRAVTGLDATDEARADEVRAIVAAALADAESRTSMRQSGMTAGWDNGFKLGSADGNYTLNLGGLMQFRYIHSLRDNSADDSVGGFENNRTFLTFSGNVVDPTWIYKIQGGFDNSMGGTGDFELRDAYIAKVLEDGWIVAAGQVKVPLQREAYADEMGDLGAGRSVIDAEFDAGYTQGIAVIYGENDFKFTGALTDGHDATGGRNTPWNMYDVELALTGRAEFKAMGEWDQFADFTSAPGSQEALLIGVSAHWQYGEAGTVATEIDAFQGGLDVSYEADGWNVYGQYLYRDIKGLEADAESFLLQGGYYLADDLELYGRYEWADNDIDADALMIVTLGVNKYFAGNKAKLSADVGYALEEVTAFWGTGTLGRGGASEGFQTDAAGEDGQMVLRAQFQLAF